MKKFAALLLAAMMAFSVTACNTNKPAASSEAAQESKAETTADEAPKTDFKAAMVTDTGGVNDQSFNQSAWEGLKKMKDDLGIEVKYTESKQETDYVTNLDKAADDENNLIWGIGFAMSDAILNAAGQNPDINYAIVDMAYEKTPENVTGVVFRAQEPSFMVGYIAAKTTKTGKVGFVGGQHSDVIDQFEYGYKAGVAYASKEMGKDITVDAQYAESFTDASKGKAIASKMFSENCDIVFHAAGGVGVGVIQAAKEADKFAIGVDRDQAYLAPENVLTSALKHVSHAVELVTKEAIDGQKIGGKTYAYGLTENAVGIPEKHDLMGDEVYNAALKIQDKIKDKTITPPANEKQYDEYVKTLK